MDQSTRQWRFKEGDEVFSADDHKIGKLVALLPDMVSPTHLVVEKGFLFKHEYTLPISHVTNYTGSSIYLDLTKAAAEHAGTGPATDTGMTDQA